MDYPHIVAGTPILQLYYASKYVGVSTLTFSDAGELTNISGGPVALGASYTASGEPSVGAILPLHFCNVDVVIPPHETHFISLPKHTDPWQTASGVHSCQISTR